MDPSDASVAVSDVALLRGYGCFEALRSYAGRLFRLEQHLDRLEFSAKALGLPPPDRGSVAQWAEEVAAAGDVIVRIVVTGGDNLSDLGSRSSVVVFAHALSPRSDTCRLLPMSAPWHSAGRATELAGAKTLSYAPNAAAWLRAQAAGFDDALLVADDATILELPMASLGWIHNESLETPSLDLGILRSITRAAVIEIAGSLGIRVVEGRYPESRLQGATEAFVMSTTWEVAPVVALGERVFAEGPVTAAITAEFRRLITAETGS